MLSLPSIIETDRSPNALVLARSATERTASATSTIVLANAASAETLLALSILSVLPLGAFDDFTGE
jgi:hypothetical protein